MIKALAATKDGRLLLILGLSDENLERLVEGQPIHIDLDQLQIPAEAQDKKLGALVIFSKATEAECWAALADLRGPETRSVVQVKGPEEVQ